MRRGADGEACGLQNRQVADAGRFAAGCLAAGVGVDGHAMPLRRVALLDHPSHCRRVPDADQFGQGARLIVADNKDHGGHFEDVEIHANVQGLARVDYLCGAIQYPVEVWVYSASRQVDELAIQVGFD